MQEILESKEKIRAAAKVNRRSLSYDRRLQAAGNAEVKLKVLVSNHRHVLSFASFGDEFHMWNFNAYLEEEGKLLLPKIEGKQMKIFAVEDRTTELKKGSLAILEPMPSLCREFDPKELTLVLVPAVAFDIRLHRIGYGGGYYDRFLKRLSPECMAIGIGFREQLHTTPFLADHHDIPLNGLALY